MRRRRLSRQQEASFLARFAVGGWTYTESFDDLVAVDGQGDPVQRNTNRGLYVLGEWNVYREAADPAQGLALFARLGVADDRVNRFGAYTGGGLVYTGLFDGRGEDQAGLGVAAVHNGDPIERALRRAGQPVDDAEVNLELTYHAPLTPWLALQGDVQYVVNPDTNPSIPNALVTTLRAQIAF